MPPFVSVCIVWFLFFFILKLLLVGFVAMTIHDSPSPVIQILIR